MPLILYALIALVASLGALFVHTFSYGDVVLRPTIVDDVLEYIHIEASESSIEESVSTIDPAAFDFVEIINSCGAHFEGGCVRARSGPGEEYPITYYFREGIVLAVGGAIEVDGQFWYKIVFEEWLRYPERVMPSMYISGEHVRGITHTELEQTVDPQAPEKIIRVSISEQRLRAYDGDVLYMDVPISTGLALSPTTLGTFTIFKKMPSRYMQGPLKGVTEDEWDLPGVPWNLYFSHEGEVIHGAYWHTKFGQRASHGCINLAPADAEQLYRWSHLATKVVIAQ